MSGLLHQLAGKLDDSRASLASFARVIDDLWHKGLEPTPATRAQLRAEVARFEALGAEMDALLESEQAGQAGQAGQARLEMAKSPGARDFKRCACGASYSAEEWGALKRLGEQLSEDAGGRYSTELRLCRCGSTLGIETKLTAATAANERQGDE